MKIQHVERSRIRLCRLLTHRQPANRHTISGGVELITSLCPGSIVRIICCLMRTHLGTAMTLYCQSKVHFLLNKRGCHPRREHAEKSSSQTRSTVSLVLLMWMDFFSVGEGFILFFANSSRLVRINFINFTDSRRRSKVHSSQFRGALLCVYEYQPQDDDGRHRRSKAAVLIKILCS